VDNAACGMLLMARTGMRQRETQVACATKAIRNWGVDFLISSKRESFPSERTRWKRYVPTVSNQHHFYTKFPFPNQHVHLVAQTATAVLSTTCLQFNPLGPAPAPPFKASSRLGQAGLILPTAAAAARARRVGRYKLNAVTER
jgi:hypothetical protein